MKSNKLIGLGLILLAGYLYFKNGSGGGMVSTDTPPIIDNTTTKGGESKQQLTQRAAPTIVTPTFTNRPVVLNPRPEDVRGIFF